MCRVAPWPDCCLCRRGHWESFTNCMWYAVWVRVCTCWCTALSARRYELRRRFFRSIRQSESCLHNLLSQRRDSEILFRLWRHSVYSIPLTKTKKFDLLFTMPWLNLCNKINKISLTALYIDVYWWV